MGTVVTQTEIKQFNDNDIAVFPVGTIITPSARDWASEHNIQISFGEPDSNKRYDFLRNTISAVMSELVSKGQKPDAKLLSELVCSCLTKLGCKIS